jgi:uncharacterized membrane protein YhaH (DUF805 family)
MKFGEAVAAGFANYINFTGRAAAPEFWFWILFSALGAVVTEFVDAAVFIHHPGLSPLNSLFTLAVLLPSLAVTVRRLHDTDRTGWWLLLVPTGLGIFLLLHWASLEGSAGENKYDRLSPAAAE